MSDKIAIVKYKNLLKKEFNTETKISHYYDCFITEHDDFEMFESKIWCLCTPVNLTIIDNDVFLKVIDSDFFGKSHYDFSYFWNIFNKEKKLLAEHPTDEEMDLIIKKMENND